MRSKRGLRELYRVGVFLIGLVFIAGGFALAVFPGPVTIPLVLIGLWIWSTEFRFARKLFDSFKAKAKDTCAHAKKHPMRSTLITAGGFAAAGGVVWAVQHLELIDKVKNAIL